MHYHFKVIDREGRKYTVALDYSDEGVKTLIRSHCF